MLIISAFDFYHFDCRVKKFLIRYENPAFILFSFEGFSFFTKKF